MKQNNSDTEEKKLNIVEILKSVEVSTKLWSPVFGIFTMEEKEPSGHSGCYSFVEFKNDLIRIHHTVYFNNVWGGCDLFIGKDGRSIDSDETSEPSIYPSKEMRDWGKFTWKKGDILATDVDTLCVFFGWANENYTKFHAKWFGRFDDGHVYKDETILNTSDWVKENNADKASRYITKLEANLGSTINRETFDLDCASARFNDGDILALDETDTYTKHIFILKKVKEQKKGFVRCYASARTLHCSIGLHAIRISNRKIRLATEFEKEQLALSMAKEGKAWQADKKIFMDVPKMLDLNYHDKILIKPSNGHIEWKLYEFEYENSKMLITSDGQCFDKDRILYCPYDENTKQLLDKK